MLEFSFNSLPADEMIQKFTVLFYNRDTAVTEIIYCKLYVYIVGHIKKTKTLYIKKHQYFTCIQYRPRALQHYTRVSCVEICHIARKFHEKNTRETLA